jgi:hypothetical protein
MPTAQPNLPTTQPTKSRMREGTKLLLLISLGCILLGLYFDHYPDCTDVVPTTCATGTFFWIVAAVALVPAVLSLIADKRTETK